MLTCTCESVTNESYPFRAHIELSVMGYNSLPRKFDIVALSGQLSVMVLLCCFVHYIVIRILRRSNLDAPCSCPACSEKQTVRAVESSFELDGKNRANRFDSLKAPLEESDIRDSRAREDCGSESESGYSSAVEDLDDQAQLDIENNQDVKDRELLEDLQRERETVAALYSELEEERSCSASAACEAMAMISRLQEEKAAVQMEARQFKRMVVEKATYDQEAIEALNELLLSREQEKIALEEEIRVCKEKLDAKVSEERRQSWRPKAKVDEVCRVLPKSKSLTLVRNEKIDTASRGGRDEQYKYVDKFSMTGSQLLTALVQDGYDGMEEQVLSNDIRRRGGKPEEVGGGEPEILKNIDVAPKAGRDEQSHNVDEVITANSQLSNATMQNGGRGMELQVGGRPTTSGISRKGGKLEEVLDDGKLKPEFPGFVSLKRRWGSQEITLKTLEQTKEERRVQDKKKGSVLEYVMKLERQQQHGGGLSHVRR